VQYGPLRDGSIGANELDGDGDGYTECDGDCDPNDPNTNPGAGEICDGIDNNCNGGTGANEYDLDGDGWMPCEGDCDDNEAAANPGEVEACDGLDNDCDGITPADEVDADGDGYHVCDGDCDDGDVDINPGATEIPGDGIDQDCDGQDYIVVVGDNCYGDANVATIPDVLNFNLTSGDESGGPAGVGYYFDDIEFEATTGMMLLIEMTDSVYDLDPYLFLLDENCDVLDRDDNSGGNDDAELIFTVPADGIYTIIATSANAGEEGAYELSISEVVPAVGEYCEYDSWSATCGDSSSAYGLNNQDDTDGPRGTDHYYDDVEFEGTAGELVEVLMESTNFDTYAYLLDENCDVLDEDDNGGGGTDALISVTLPADGVYTMVFTSYYSLSDGQPATGAYDWSLDCTP